MQTITETKDIATAMERGLFRPTDVRKLPLAERMQLASRTVALALRSSALGLWLDALFDALYPDVAQQVLDAFEDMVTRNILTPASLLYSWQKPLCMDQILKGYIPKPVLWLSFEHRMPLALDTYVHVVGLNKQDVLRNWCAVVGKDVIKVCADTIRRHVRTLRAIFPLAITFQRVRYCKYFQSFLIVVAIERNDMLTLHMLLNDHPIAPQKVCDAAVTKNNPRALELLWAHALPTHLKHFGIQTMLYRILKYQCHNPKASEVLTWYKKTLLDSKLVSWEPVDVKPLSLRSLAVLYQYLQYPYPLDFDVVLKTMARIPSINFLRDSHLPFICDFADLVNVCFTRGKCRVPSDYELVLLEHLQAVNETPQTVAMLANMDTGNEFFGEWRTDATVLKSELEQYMIGDLANIVLGYSGFSNDAFIKLKRDN